VWLCRWVVTHSLCRFQLLWPRSCCLHHTEHPFGFSEGWNRYALALLILRTSGWIPHRQNCLPVMAHYESSIHTVAFFVILFILSKADKITVRTDLKFERRPRSLKIRPTDTSSHCFTLIWFCVTLIKIWIDSSYPEGNFGENQLLDGSISLSPIPSSGGNDLHVSSSQRKLPSSFHLTSPCPGIVHHLSGLNKNVQWLNYSFFFF